MFVVAGNRSEGSEDEVHSGVEFLLQPLHIQNPALTGLPVVQKDLRHCVDHILSAANEGLVREEGWSHSEMEVNHSTSMYR